MDKDDNSYVSYDESGGSACAVSDWKLKEQEEHDKRMELCDLESQIGTSVIYVMEIQKGNILFIENNYEGERNSFDPVELSEKPKTFALKGKTQSVKHIELFGGIKIDICLDDCVIHYPDKLTILSTSPVVARQKHYQGENLAEYMKLLIERK